MQARVSISDRAVALGIILGFTVFQEIAVFCVSVWALSATSKPLYLSLATLGIVIAVAYFTTLAALVLEFAGEINDWVNRR